MEDSWRLASSWYGAHVSSSRAALLTHITTQGFGAGAAETIAPLTIADVFFLHERGAVMALYTSFLSVGVSFGLLISG